MKKQLKNVQMASKERDGRLSGLKPGRFLKRGTRIRALRH